MGTLDQCLAAADRLFDNGPVANRHEQARLAKLAAAGPLRPARSIATADVDGLALFDAVRSPTFL